MFFVGLLICTLRAAAIDPPSLRCLSVDDAGGVTLTWIPVNTADFDRYEVWFSTDGQNFSRIYQVGNSQINTYLHASADAINQAQCYYFVAACSATASASSDTLCTLELYLTNQNNGLAILSWSPMHNPEVQTATGDYEIFCEYPPGSWQMLGSTGQFIYRDTISICAGSLSYRVEMADESGCRSVSRFLSDVFSDGFPPDIPQLDSVSVEVNTSRIRLGWEPSWAPDAFAYIIYHLENSLWIPVDTVFGINNTTWVDGVNSPNTPQHYRIAALDSCMNSSPMSDVQHSIRMTSTHDLCRREAYLSWDEYENLPMDVEFYRVYCSENGGPFLYAGETAGNQTSYTLSGLTPQSRYVCIVRAVNYGGNVTAASDQCSFTFNSQDNQDFAYIRYVSVVDNKNLEIKVSTGTTVSFQRVHLYRSVGDDLHFVHLDVMENNGTDEYVFLDDRDLQVDRILYYYKASVENDCDLETAFSNISHNILLRGRQDNESRTNTLEWNSYDGWEIGASGYQLFRKSEADTDFEMVGGALSANRYDDDVTHIRREGEGFSYFVEAEEIADSYGFMEKSRSNTVIVKQLPQTYIPNAFCPRTGGINSVFLPVNSYVTMENYNMYIYSREGVLLFHTTDPYTGWNGGYNGNLMPPACYIYRISYTYGADGEFEAVGTVTLVR